MLSRCPMMKEMVEEDEEEALSEEEEAEAGVDKVTTGRPSNATHAIS